MQVSTSLVSEPKRPAPGELAGRHARHDAFPLCGLAGARGASGLRAQPTAPRTMAVARMAQAREGADEILAVQPAGVDQPAETGGHGEAALAHRARLRGTEAGAWTGPLRRTELARLSPPCQLLHSGLRLPGGGTMPFFPHARLPTTACRQPPTSPTPPATRCQTSWRCRLERNGIIRIPSPPCAARSQPTWLALCPGVPAACASSYNTVVLGAESVLHRYGSTPLTCVRFRLAYRVHRFVQFRSARSNGGYGSRASAARVRQSLPCQKPSAPWLRVPDLESWYSLFIRLASRSEHRVMEGAGR